MDKETKEARSLLRAHLWSGVAVSVIGGIIMVVSWPHTTNGMLGPEDHGSALGVAAGAAITWIGNMIILPGLIGYGVWYGREASPRAPQL